MTAYQRAREAAAVTGGLLLALMLVAGTVHVIIAAAVLVTR